MKKSYDVELQEPKTYLDLQFNELKLRQLLAEIENDIIKLQIMQLAHQKVKADEAEKIKGLAAAENDRSWFQRIFGKKEK